MRRRRRHDHGRARSRPGQVAVHGPDLLAGLARRHVHAARRVRSSTSLEPGQGRPGARVPRVACGSVGASGAPGVSSISDLSGAGAVPGVAADSTRAVADRVRDAAARGGGVRIVGQGTWLTAGRVVHGAESLSLREHAGIIDYVPGDLTLTARAGTTLGEIREATGAHNQWL